MGLVIVIFGAVVLAFMGDFSVLAVLLAIASCIGIALLAGAAPGVFIAITVLVVLINLLISKN